MDHAYVQEALIHLLVLTDQRRQLAAPIKKLA